MPIKPNSPTLSGDVPKKRKVSQSESEKKSPAVSFEVYHSEAATFQSIGEPRKAINSYTKALELKPREKSCLIARAQCYLLLGEADKALSDANETLKDDCNFIKGILMKAESYYQMMQFEYALMFYHRGNKLRPEVQAFRLGIQKSREAIDNSIGENAGLHLQNRGDLSFFFEEHQQKPKSSVTHSKTVAKFEEAVEERQTKSGRRDNKTCKQLLGELFADKEFLEKLLKETEAASNQSETNKAIRSLAIQGLDYLDTRTEFWQQQKPMYSRKRDKNMRENTCQSNGSEKSKNPTQWVLKNLEVIDEAQADGKFEESLKLANKVLKSLEKRSDYEICNRPELLANLHSCIGNAHLELAEYVEALQHHNADYDIAKKNHLLDAESRSLDNVGRVYARMGKFDKAVEIWKKKLPMSKSSLESTWLYHEIGRCYLEMGDFSDAKEYGEKSLSAAEDADDDLWELNARVLIAQSQVKLNELHSALESFEKAQDMAHVQGDSAAELAIQKAIDDIEFALRQKNRDSKSERPTSPATNNIQDQDPEAESKLNDEVGATEHYKESEDTEKEETQKYRIKNEYATGDDMETSAEAKETQSMKDCDLNEIGQGLSDEDAETQEKNKEEEKMGKGKLGKSYNGQSQRAAKQLNTQNSRKEADSINKTQSKTRDKSKQRKVTMEVTNKAEKEEKIQKEKKSSGNQKVQQNNKKDANSQPKPEGKGKQGKSLPNKYQTSKGLQRAF